MQLINNELSYELIYDPTDAPVITDFANWQFLVQALKACSPSITEVSQLGIYGPDYPRFSLTVSTALTSDEVAAVLVAFQNFPLNGYKSQAIAQVSALSFIKRQALIPDYQVINALGEVYDMPGSLKPPLYKTDCLATIAAFRAVYYNTVTAINAAADQASVDTIVAGVQFPTAIVTQ